MNMHWPQITVIVWVAMALGFALANNGKPRGVTSFWSSTVSMVIWIWLLTAGGFFRG